MKRLLETILLGLALTSCSELPRPDIPITKIHRPNDKKIQSSLFKNYFGEHRYDLQVDIPIYGKISVGRCRFTLEKLTDEFFEEFKSTLKIDLDPRYQEVYGGETPFNIESILEFNRNKFKPIKSKCITTAKNDGKWIYIITTDLYDLRNEYLRRETKKEDNTNNSTPSITKKTYDALSHILNVINISKEELMDNKEIYEIVLGNIRSENSCDILSAFYNKDEDSIQLVFPPSSLMHNQKVKIKFYYAKIRDQNKHIVDISNIELTIGDNTLYLERLTNP